MAHPSLLGLNTPPSFLKSSTVLAWRTPMTASRVTRACSCSSVQVLGALGAQGDLDEPAPAPLCELPVNLLQVTCHSGAGGGSSMWIAGRMWQHTGCQHWSRRSGWTCSRGPLSRTPSARCGGHAQRVRGSCAPAQPACIFVHLPENGIRCKEPEEHALLRILRTLKVQHTVRECLLASTVMRQFWMC